MNAAHVYSTWAKHPHVNPREALSTDARAQINWWVTALNVVPDCPLHGAAGHLSLWGPKSPKFANWRALAVAEVLRVVETDASKKHSWSYHFCNANRAVSGQWPKDFAGPADTADAINFKEVLVRSSSRAQ